MPPTTSSAGSAVPAPSTRPRAVSETAAPDGGSNQVQLTGRVNTVPAERELPSGARVVTFRIVVPRSPTVMTRGSRQTSDWVECAAWSAQSRQRALAWSEGDTVEVEGALRRRHYRTAQGVASVVEIEVLGGRRVRRADGSRPRSS